MTNYAWYVPGLVAVMSPGKVLCYSYSNAVMYTHIASPLPPLPRTPHPVPLLLPARGGGASSDPTLVFGEQSGASFATKADEHKVVVRGLTEVQVTSATQMRQFLDKGQSNYTFVYVLLYYAMLLHPRTHRLCFPAIQALGGKSGRKRTH